MHIPLYVEKEIEDNLPSMEEAISSLKAASEKAWLAEERLKILLEKFLV